MRDWKDRCKRGLVLLLTAALVGHSARYAMLSVSAEEIPAGEESGQDDPEEPVSAEGQETDVLPEGQNEELEMTTVQSAGAAVVPGTQAGEGPKASEPEEGEQSPETDGALELEEPGKDAADADVLDEKEGADESLKPEELGTTVADADMPDEKADADESLKPEKLGTAAPEDETADEAVKKVKEQLAALPSLDEVKSQTEEEQRGSYDQAQEVYDAYESLTEEQKAQIEEAEEIFALLFEYFNGLIIWSEASTVENISAIEDVNTIQIGDYISMGTYYGERIVWRCVAIDENGPLMLSDKVLCLKSFDAKGDSDKHYVPGVFSDIRKQYGSNCWAESNLREWLNSDDEKVAWSHIRPSAANVYGGFNAYDNEAGFLTSFSNEELGRIKTVTQKVYPNEAEHSRGLTEGGTWDYEPRDGNVLQANDINNDTYYMNVADKVFVPNIIQLKAVCRNLGEDYVKAYPTQQAVDHSDFSHADFTASKGCGYWTCHVATSGFCYEHMKVINPDGYISGTNIWNSDHGGAYISVIGVRPALYLQNVDDEIVIDEKVIEDRVAYINQHFNSAITNQWNTYHEVIDTMSWYDNNIYTEASHATVVGLDFTANVITLDINGVITQISANAYNGILLDMYYDLGMNDSEYLQALYDDSLEKAITKVSKPILDFIKKSSTVGTDWLKFNEYRFLDDLEKWYMGEYSNYSLLQLFEKNGITLAPNKEETELIEELKGMGMTSEELKEIGGVVGNIKTVGEFIDHLREITCATTLVNMNETYRQLLREIREKASKIEGHDWEKTDLIEALDYEIYYREEYKKNITWESVELVIKTALEIDKKDVKKLRNKLWKDPAEKFITDTFKNGGAILDKLSAVQLGVEVGWSVSDSLFNLTDSTDAYYKGKAYGVLEEILIEILDDTSGDLELCEKTESVSVIDRKFKVALKFDYAFQMYRHVEKKGCSAYADYEKSFCLDYSENWLKSFLRSGGYAVEIALRVPFDDLSVVFNDIAKREILRNYNVLFYKRRAEFADNLICHGRIFDTKEGYILYNQIIHDKYMEMLKIDYELAAVLCPVEVDVYDEDNQLVGTVSKTGNTMEKNLNVLVYRNESLDANIIVYPSGYSIKIRGIADGTMNAFGSYYSDGDIQNAVAYYNVPINNDYVADFAIADTTDYLIDNNSKLSDIKINDTDIVGFDKSVTQYNVKIAEGITEVPQVTAKASNPNAAVDIKQAVSLTGTEAERTAEIIITATDGVSKTVYRVTFDIKVPISENNNTANNTTNVGNNKTNTGKIKNNSTNGAQILTEKSSPTALDASPETSDNMHIMHWVVILIISSMALCIGLKRWKKSEYFDE